MSKKMLSYFLPMLDKTGMTQLGQFYEICFENGKKVLNSKNANYSFGSLHQVMQKGITHVLKQHSIESVLLLGLGAGSAVQILNQKNKNQHQIHVLEIDADIIQLAKSEFNINAQKPLIIINESAEQAVNVFKNQTFDFIIDDVFWDDTIPDFCFAQQYLLNNAKLLNQNGVYMRNIMSKDLNLISNYEKTLATVFQSVEILKTREYGNLIYICKIN